MSSGGEESVIPQVFSCGLGFACRLVLAGTVPARDDDRSTYGRAEAPIAVPSPGKPCRWRLPGASSIVRRVQGNQSWIPAGDAMDVMLDYGMTASCRISWLQKPTGYWVYSKRCALSFGGESLNFTFLDGTAVMTASLACPRPRLPKKDHAEF